MFKKLRRDSFGDGWAKISRMEWAPWSKQDILSTHSTLLSPWHDTWVCTIWWEAKATILVEAFHFSEPKRLVERQSGFYWFWECEKKGLKLVPVSSSWTQISTSQTKNVWHINPWNEAVICSVFYLGSRSGSRSMMYNVSSDMANALLLRCGQPAGKLGFGTTNGYLSVDRQWSSDRPPKSSALTGGGATGTGGIAALNLSRSELLTDQKAHTKAAKKACVPSYWIQWGTPPPRIFHSPCLRCRIRTSHAPNDLIAQINPPQLGGRKPNPWRSSELFNLRLWLLWHLLPSGRQGQDASISSFNAAKKPYPLLRPEPLGLDYWLCSGQESLRDKV